MSRNGRKGGAKGRNRRGSVGGLWVLYTSYLGSTLGEIHDVFGDGHEYDWALAGDTEVRLDEEAQKPEMKYQDVFEPSEIRARMLTEDDDLIRVQDIPEQEDDLELLEENTGTPFRNRLTCLCRGRDGRSPPASSSSRRKQVVESSEDVLDDDEDLPQVQDIRRIWDDERAGRGQEDEEVPCIWTHKRDYISYFNPQEIRTRIDLTSLAELQRIHISGQKYHSLVECRNALFAAYSRLNVEDYHSERWLSMKYESRKQDTFDLHFHDDKERTV
ncbi:hypothetical protein EDD15DRAFT_2430787 [Pisolithus albus]|nr:hypothetical protein EDD15DRAFT_2430787 [Pisolithus albus]